MVASVARFPKRQHIARFDSFAFPHYRRCVCISYFILFYGIVYYSYSGSVEILGCSKILLIHIHPSRHCRHACHLSAYSFYNRASAVAAHVTIVTG